jgi:hypothetical protein
VLLLLKNSLKVNFLKNYSKKSFGEDAQIDGGNKQQSFNEYPAEPKLLCLFL